MEFFVTSESTGDGRHVHVVMRTVVMEPVLDEMGQPAVDPQTGQPLPPREAYKYEVSPGGRKGEQHIHNVIELEGGRIALEIEADGHTHVDLLPIEDKYPTRPEKEDYEVISRLYKLYDAAFKHDEKSIKKGRESDKFYKGEQWDTASKQKLEAEGRACLVINDTQKAIDDIVGYQRQQRSDIRFKPVGDTDQAVCDILNTLSKVLLEQNNFQFEESAAFEDMCIPGRGEFCLYMSTRDDIRGDLKIEKFPWDQVCWGPHLKTDASDAEYVTKSQMWSLSKLKARYPKKAKEVSEGYMNLRELSVQAESYGVEHADDEYKYDDGLVSIPLISGETKNIDVLRKEIKVIELEEKIYVPVVILYNQETDETLTTYGWKDKIINQIKQLPNIYVVEQEIQKIRHTKVAGGILLEDDYVSDRPIDEFSIVPVYAKKRAKDFWGLVERGKDAQVEHNKRISQSIDIVNFSLVHGFVYDSATFESKADENNFREQGTRPGFIGKVANVDRPPRLLQGGKFPSESMGMADVSRERLYSLIGVDPTRHAGANTSANAILQAEKSKLTGLEYLFRNMSQAKKKIGKLMVAYIQEYYSAERIYEIVADRNASEPVEVNGRPFDELKREAIIQLIEDQDLTKVDVVVDEAAWSPTQRLATFAALSELLAKGAPIPFEMLVPLMDVPEDYKRQISQSIMAQQQAQAEASKAQADSEVEKTLIAQNIITPQIAQKYGIPQGLPEAPLPQGAVGNQERVPSPVI